MLPEPIQCIDSDDDNDKNDSKTPVSKPLEVVYIDDTPTPPPTKLHKSSSSTHSFVSETSLSKLNVPPVLANFSNSSDKMEGKLLPLKRSRPVTDENGEVVKLMTEKPPAHCILKVDSFSVLQDTLDDDDSFKSTKFSVGGYSWVLSVYPKGNKLEQEDDHLSVYVTLVDDLTFGNSVDVVFRFFLYDHLKAAYLSVLDLREKRFNALKRRWGIPKFLPISTFNDADYGFLVGDSCIFGAEVFVINNQQVKISTISHVEEICDGSYTWRIENFSSLRDIALESPPFWVDGWSWNLKLYASRAPRTKGKSLSLFMILNNEQLADEDGLMVDTVFYLKNQRQGKDHEEACIMPKICVWARQNVFLLKIYMILQTAS